jgi:hypothetical protein
MKYDFHQALRQNLCHSTGQQSKRAHMQQSGMYLKGGQFESASTPAILTVFLMIFLSPISLVPG